MNISDKVRFSELVGLLERISKSKIPEKKNLLNQFLSQWRNHALSVKLTDSDDYEDISFYPVMRLILPSLDKSRDAYGIKEYTIAKIYCDILCLSRDNPDAQRLMQYKIPKFNKDKSSDFSQIVYDIIKDRCPFQGQLTIYDVNSKLDEIAEAEGNSRKEIINETLLFLLKNMTALDQKWLIRIILKNLHLGLNIAAIFNCYHVCAEEYYNATNDLAAVCRQFKEASMAKEEIKINIQLFKPFKPMLSQRGNIRHIMEQLNDNDFVLETKYDGERVQLHKSGDTYRYWSRNGLEWTNSYGDNGACGTLTQYIHSQFQCSVENCILDGEMMGFNVATRTMGCKTDNFDVKRHNIEELSGYLPCFIIFDVLYLNNEVLCQKSLLERKKILDSSILTSDLVGKIQISPWTIGTSQDDCLEAFNKAIEHCDEGVMVKCVDSKYKIHSRKDGWFKLKPDYVLGLHEEIDCVIIGGYFSKGTMIGQFLCGVKQGDKYLSFTRVGSGFSRKVLYEYNVKMRPHWKEFKKDNIPEWLILAGKHRLKPDLYIEPANSFIVQLKAAEIVSSNNYATECTLRFCRIDCFRDDKSPLTDCMSLDDLKELRQQNKGKLALHPLEINSDDDEAVQSELNAQKRQAKRDNLKPKVPDCFKSTVPTKKKKSESTNTNSLFSDKELCIIISETSYKGYSKKDLETFVYENSGSVVQNPTNSTFAVIPDKVTIKIKNLISSGLYDIIKPDWLIACLTGQRFILPRPSEFIKMCKRTQKYYSTIYDSAGDSFKEPITEDGLKELTKTMDTDKIKIPLLTYQEKSIFIDDNLANDLDMTFMNGCVVYFHTYDAIDIVSSSLLERLKINVRLAGAKVITNLQRDAVTHVVVLKEISGEEKFKIFLINKSKMKMFYIVSVEWVTKSLQHQQHLRESSFLVQL